ncbi:MAG: FAD-dependent oxidoreductase [Dehalococcoidales bacterium]|nr:MAG: FAD-dependent oxidoreductase [Dehalococcoidales bacterium]
MVLATETYYTRRPEIPAFIHTERCWPEVDKYSPCEAVCPLHQDVPNYIMAIARGDASKALAIIRETNPLPSICGRVCHHPCETECNRKVVDSPVAIQALKRFAADWGSGRKPRPAKRKKVERVAVVGGGPAGLTAAHDLVKMGYGAAVFDAAPIPGGILTSAIPDFILSTEAVQADIDYIEALGVKIHSNIRIGRDIGLDTLSRQGFGAVLITIGAQKSAELNIPGAKLSGIVPALQLLGEAKRRELVAMKGKVWVIGGGAVAMDCARTALRLGADEVHAACLECRADMPAYDWEVEEAEREGVNIHPSLAPQRFTSKNGSRVSGIKFKRVASTSLDSEGRISWTLVEGAGSDYSVDADIVIVAIGQATDTTGLSGGPVKISRGGAVVINEATGETSAPGVFAAGDVTTLRGTVSEAMAAGRRAARSIDQYLSGRPIVAAKEDLEMITIKPEQVPVYLSRHDQWEVPKLTARQAITTYKEVNLGYTFWQAVEEARRCLNCRMCANCMFERGQLCFETAGRLL